MGPTAAGKTSCAVELVKRYPLEIVSVDSALIYKEMNIGTAKPDEATLQQAPHRLISFLDPAESYSVAAFCQQATQAIDDIHSNGKIPLLVGGTMMYFRALQNGLAKLPEADKEIRAEINEQAKSLGWQTIHQELMKIDPLSAARIHCNDQQRIQRALEVFRISGVPLSQLLKIAQAKAFKYDVLKMVIGPEQRRSLDDLIAQRFEQMLEQGFLDEVKALQARGDLSLELPSMRCVGYRQAWEYLLGDCSKQEMINKVINATQQLAKRQYTWLRSETDSYWFDSDRQEYENSKLSTKLSTNVSVQQKVAPGNLFDLVDKHV